MSNLQSFIIESTKNRLEETALSKLTTSHSYQGTFYLSLVNTATVPLQKYYVFNHDQMENHF